MRRSYLLISAGLSVVVDREYADRIIDAICGE